MFVIAEASEESLERASGLVEVRLLDLCAHLFEVPSELDVCEARPPGAPCLIREELLDEGEVDLLLDTEVALQLRCEFLHRLADARGSVKGERSTKLRNELVQLAVLLPPALEQVLCFSAFRMLGSRRGHIPGQYGRSQILRMSRVIRRRSPAGGSGARAQPFHDSALGLFVLPEVAHEPSEGRERGLQVRPRDLGLDAVEPLQQLRVSVPNPLDLGRLVRQETLDERQVHVLLYGQMGAQPLDHLGGRLGRRPRFAPSQSGLELENELVELAVLFPPPLERGVVAGIRRGHRQGNLPLPMTEALLEQTDLFRGLDPGALAPIRAEARLQAYAARDYLYFEGQPAEQLWVVRTGEVRTLRGSASGRIMTLEHLRPGDAFGLTSMLRGTEYTDSAQGIVDGETWRVPRRVIVPLLEKHPPLMQRLLAIVAGRLERAHSRLCSFAHDSVPARIARLILTEEPEGGKIQMTRRTLGDEVGTTVETTIRVLRNFERAGWIEGGVGWIRLRDRKALERIAEGEKPG